MGVSDMVEDGGGPAAPGGGAPRVSVVIPAFNAEAGLAAAVSSAQRQTLAHTEILIVDAGPTDGHPTLTRTSAAATTGAKVRATRPPSGADVERAGEGGGVTAE